MKLNLQTHAMKVTLHGCIAQHRLWGMAGMAWQAGRRPSPRTGQTDRRTDLPLISHNNGDCFRSSTLQRPSQPPQSNATPEIIIGKHPLAPNPYQNIRLNCPPSQMRQHENTHATHQSQ